MKYIFIIYSHKLAIEKSVQQYERYLKKYETKLGFRVYIVYGDKHEFLKNNTCEYITRDKFLILNVEDDYVNLNKKTTMLFRSVIVIFPNIMGCFKCDSDVIINIDSFAKTIHYIENCETLKTPINYCGKMTFADNTEITMYCGGPLYYLSNKSMRCFSGNFSTSYNVAEDRMVGELLHDHKIPAIYGNTYSDRIEDIKNMSVHNKFHKNTLFQRIKGGLGNQLFQIISGYGIAKKNNMNFIIIDTSDIRRDFTHTNNNTYAIKTVFNNFPVLNMNCINVDVLNYYVEPAEKCFEYSEMKFNDDIFLDGYFQNEKYFSFCKNEVFYKLKSNHQYERFFEMMFGAKSEYYREKTANGYFIHVRRGDYVKHPLYSINYDKYFASAISYVLGQDPDAYFFVVSDDIEYCKTYSVLEGINKEFMTLHDIETLYFMSYCKKGAICSNSTFSWWGSYLNENPDKIVTFPSKWVNNDWVNDIYYEGAVTIYC